MSQHNTEVSVREAAKSLSVRLNTMYQLFWDGTISGRKDERGEWRIEAESVERYRLRRTVRNTSSRTTLQRDAIDVGVAAVVGA